MEPSQLCWHVEAEGICESEKKLLRGNLHCANKERNKGKKGKAELKKRRRTNREMEYLSIIHELSVCEC